MKGLVSVVRAPVGNNVWCDVWESVPMLRHYTLPALSQER